MPRGGGGGALRLEVLKENFAALQFLHPWLQLEPHPPGDAHLVAPAKASMRGHEA